MLYKRYSRQYEFVYGRGGDGGFSAHIGCGTLNPDGGHLPTRVHLEGARLGGVYRCGLVVVCEGAKEFSSDMCGKWECMWRAQRRE